MEIEMPFAPLSGVDLYYELDGDGYETLVFAHGAGGNALTWFQQVAYFSQSFRCVTFDHRGYGRSVDESGEGLHAYARDLEGLLDHLGIERVSLIGQSMGGLTCLGFAATHPDRVQRLVMSATVLGVSEELGDETIRNYLPRVQQGLTSLTQGFAEREPVKAMLYQKIRGLSTRPAPALDPLPPSITALQREEFQIPTLFLVGDLDAIATVEMARTASTLLRSQMVVLPDVGHLAYWEQPEAWNHVVGGFLSARKD